MTEKTDFLILPAYLEPAMTTVRSAKFTSTAASELRPSTSAGVALVAGGGQDGEVGLAVASELLIAGADEELLDEERLARHARRRP